jgi:rhomboid protease GluP
MRIRASHVLAASILMAWIASAVMLKQPVTAEQRSSALIAFGAADSAIFKNHQWWRLLTSQWLHVKFMHMLFNVAGVLIAGVYVERRSNWVLPSPCTWPEAPWASSRASTPIHRK